MKTGLTVAILAWMFLHACASAPTAEQIAAFDYGSCPDREVYEPLIRERFKGDLLNAFAGEPMMWPPQRFWYRDPLKGGKVTTGYLVPVMADRTRGNNLFLGKRLYGVLVRDGAIVADINPNNLANMRLREGVSPVPADERGWIFAHQSTQGRVDVMEFTLPEETVDAWTELVTVQTIRNVPFETTLESMRAAVERAHRADCREVVHRVISTDTGRLLYAQTTLGCASFPDEYSLRLTLRGARAVFEVSYTSRDPLSDDDLATWTRLLDKADHVRDCPV